MTKETKSTMKNFLLVEISKPKNLKQFFRVVRRFFINIKYFIQRGKYGVSDQDLGNLDMYLGNVLYNSLKAFADITTGCPYKYEELYGEEKSFEKWQNEIYHMADISKEMINSEFNFMDNTDNRPYTDRFKDAELKKQVLERTLFNWMIENFDNLWD